MPCRVDPTPEELAESRRLREQAITGPLHEEISVLKEELKEREAMLCGVFTVLENGFESHGITFYLAAVLEQVNWKEAGVTMHATETWWEDHKERDAEQRAQEAAARERRRRDILARLSAEEREILGL